MHFALRLTEYIRTQGFCSAMRLLESQTAHQSPFVPVRSQQMYTPSVAYRVGDAIRSLVMRWALGGLLIFFCLSGIALADHERQHVRVQLKWHHQFQFAGYYAAQIKGYYSDEGLEVELIEGGVGQPPTEQVLAGHA